MVERADDLFDLTSNQERSLIARSRSYLAWHREKQLPQYLSFINDLKRTSQKKITPRDVEKVFSRFLKLRDDLYYKLEPIMISTMQGLSEDQIRYFEKELLQKHRELEKRELSLKGSEYLKNRFERSIDRLEYWFDDLEKTQKKDFFSFLEKHPNSRKNWFKKRIERQKALLDALKQNKSNSHLKRKLRTLFLKPADPKWIEDAKRYIVKFSGHLNKRQKKFFIQRLESLQNNIHHILKG